MNILKQGFVSPKSNSHFRYNAWPTVISLSDGTLLAAWSGERFKHICPLGRVMASRSYDGGYTWLPPYCIQDTTLDDRDAGLLQVGDRILMTSVTNDVAMQRKYNDAHWLHTANTPEKRAFVLSYLDMLTEEDEKLVGPTLAVSKDNGYTFSEPVNLPLTSPHGPMLTKEGKILFVGKFSSYGHRFCPDLVPAIYAMELDTDCNTVAGPWLVAPRFEGMPEHCEWCEPHAALMPNGDILVAIRYLDKKADIHTIYLCRSTDGGKTYTKAEPTGWDGLPPHIFVHSSGAVIMTYGRRHAPLGVRARISYDNGYTFGEELVLRDDGLDWDLGYPSTAENAQGQLVTVYYMKEKDDPNENRIQYTVWEL